MLPTVEEKLRHINPIEMETLDALSSAVMLAFSILGMCSAALFISIVALHRQCHTTTIMLALNTVVAGFMSNLVFGIQSAYQLLVDGDDSLCIVRGYFVNTVCGLLYHTLCVQALHRLFVTVLAKRRSLQSKRLILMLVAAQWLFSSSFVLPIALRDRLRYNQVSRICPVSIELIRWSE